MATKLIHVALVTLLACGLQGCAGYQTGKALNGLDTESAEEKEESAWFKSFYGSNHCVWGSSNCSGGEKSSGGGGWGGGTDTSAGHSDSGSY